MTMSPRLHTLQHISDTSHKPVSTAPVCREAPDILTALKSLPEHKPLLPILLSHNVPPKFANACAVRYDKYATQLRLEAKLAPYLINLRKESPAAVYSAPSPEVPNGICGGTRSILNTALKKLKRDPVELQNWDVAYPAPLWLPVSVLHRALVTHPDGLLVNTRPAFQVRPYQIGGRSPLLPSSHKLTV